MNINAWRKKATYCHILLGARQSVGRSALQITVTYELCVMLNHRV